MLAGVRVSVHIYIPSVHDPKLDSCVGARCSGAQLSLLALSSISFGQVRPVTHRDVWWTSTYDVTYSLLWLTSVRSEQELAAWITGVLAFCGPVCSEPREWHPLLVPCTRRGNTQHSARFRTTSVLREPWSCLLGA